MAQINKPNEYFNTKLYTGNGVISTDSQSITGVGFQPDWVWIKNRDTTNNHAIGDSVRGGNKTLFTSLTNAERTEDWYIQSFDSDGFTVGYSGDTNGNGNNLASWNWLAGGTASSNTDGSITSSVSANTTSGFSIVSYTGNGTGGATFGHGLGSAPKIVIIKCRSLGTESWQFWFNNTSRLNLNSTTASLTTHPISTSSTLVTTPSSSNDSWNTSGQTYISYCFSEKKGFSKFGSYTGNGNADGTFIYTGFRPAFLILKRTDSSADWFLHDNKRNGFNPDNDYLQPNLSSAETNFDNLVDFVSNGWKIRDATTAYNASGGSYIYMAFAEQPLVGSNNVCATAR